MPYCPIPAARMFLANRPAEHGRETIAPHFLQVTQTAKLHALKSTFFDALEVEEYLPGGRTVQPICMPAPFHTFSLPKTSSGDTNETA